MDWFFSVACLTREGDLIALLGKRVTGIKLLGAHAPKRCKKKSMSDNNCVKLSV